MSNLNRAEMELYLRNLVVIARADGRLDDAEREALERARVGLGGERRELIKALSTFGNPDVDLEGLLRFSARIRCLEDMIEVAICDDEMSTEERELLLRAALAIGVNQEMVNRMLGEAQARLRGLAG